MFLKNGFYVTIDTPFYAGENTVCADISEDTNIFSLQIEINSKLIHLKDERNKFLITTKVLNQVVTLLDKEL